MIEQTLLFYQRDNYSTETNFDLILSSDDECFQIIILFLISAQYISSALKNRINFKLIILTRKQTHRRNFVYVSAAQLALTSCTLFHNSAYSCSTQLTENRATLELSFLISRDVSTNSILKVFIKQRRY